MTVADDDFNNSIIHNFLSGNLLWITFVLIFLYYWRKFIQGGQFNKDNIRIDGKVVIVTGANSGIGKATVLDLAKRGGKIYLACRNQERGETACLEIIKETKNRNIFFRQLDLSSFKSIRLFCKNFLEEEKRLDILINNAGVMACPKQLTEDGFELQFGTNHLGHFLLTNLLLKTLKDSAPSRIINLSSMAHERGKLNKEDINYEKSYNLITAYCQSKLANVLFTRELEKRIQNENVFVFSVHPGVVKTELSRHLWIIDKIINLKILSPLMELLTKTPTSGAQTSLFCCLDPDLTKSDSGKYFKDCKETTISENAKNDDDAKWLWEMSEKWTGLSS